MRRTLQCLLAAAVLAASATAQLNVPSDGSDGAFNPTQNVEVDLGLALPDRSWQDPGNGNGVYDPVQWAVVFKFTSVNIPAGVTVTFKNHPKDAHVVWLVQGNVTIAGTVDLTPPYVGIYPVGGPGGFAGGALATVTQPGFGYGGGNDYRGPGHGSYASLGAGSSVGVYGGAEIIPLVGGSGGATIPTVPPSSGGGGAILIAAAQNVTVTGRVRANPSSSPDNRAYSGSGGSIRIAADSVITLGELNALGFRGASYGRIRLEANSLTSGNSVTPTASVLQPIPNNMPQIWPDVHAAEVKIDSIAGRSVTTDPSGNMSLPDLSITSGGMVPVVLVTRNVPPSWKVTVRVVRQDRDTAVLTQATFNPNTGKWEAMVELGDNGNYLVAKAAAPGYPD